MSDLPHPPTTITPPGPSVDRGETQRDAEIDPSTYAWIELADINLDSLAEWWRIVDENRDTYSYFGRIVDDTTHRVILWLLVEGQGSGVTYDMIEDYAGVSYATAKRRVKDLRDRNLVEVTNSGISFIRFLTYDYVALAAEVLYNYSEDIFY